MNIDTGTPTGKLMLNLLGSIAEFERQIMLERQREGIAKAKSEGKYKGRAPTGIIEFLRMILSNAPHRGQAHAPAYVSISFAIAATFLSEGWKGTR
jgi:DNA invertase Pin-like site-specific DNA recombinase